jgi:hypothetical protein
LSTETKNKIIHVKFPDVLIDNYILSKNPRKDIVDFFFILRNSFSRFRRDFGDLYRSIWFDEIRREFWEMRFEKVKLDYTHFYRIKLRNENREIIVDVNDVDFGKKFSLFLADNIDNVDGIFKLLNEMDLHVMLG